MPKKSVMWVYGYEYVTIFLTQYVIKYHLFMKWKADIHKSVNIFKLNMSSKQIWNWVFNQIKLNWMKQHSKATTQTLNIQLLSIDCKFNLFGTVKISQRPNRIWLTLCTNSW